ncbi:protein-PII uridylyltransferase [Corynebacterium phocae]|uniref:Protein-PII uridylyltransferase n=1 Tax=Corynebacterium phocae TaxID=161895 RepID=A0A1L7D691_9CORY|nr:protein-PII uridylyltransferase [Corynebacterium phocae]
MRAQAQSRAFQAVSGVQLPPGTGLAATGSFARREMTPRSDIDLILIHGPGFDESQAQDLWYPIWEEKYHLDVAVRTPEEAAHIAAQSPQSGLAQLDLAYVAGNKALVDSARAKLLATWRRQLQTGFDGFIDHAISRWHRSGAVATMTNPDLKNGRGGLRDIQLLRAFALGNLADMPNLERERDLLLDVRTLLHVHARRHRDTLDPEFAADIARDLGLGDRYELTAALVEAASAVEKALERSLAQARALVTRRSTQAVRRPLDIDVIDAGGQIDLSRKPNFDDPWLVARVAAASARTGLTVPEATWERLSHTPQPSRWTRAAVEDFYAILSSPLHSARVIRELDAAGLWERFVPDWGHIRGRLPRERTHIHSVDAHTLATVAGVAAVRTTVARPDLLLLAALFHDIGKGYGRPHEQVGSELVARQAQRMGLDVADRSRVQTVVAEHTTLARLAARLDPNSEEALDEFLSAAHFDPLVINMLAVLAKADAQATGPGVWTRRLESCVETLRGRALVAVRPRVLVTPRVVAPAEEVCLDVDWDAGLLRIGWRGPTQRDMERLLALIGSWGWTIVRSAMARQADTTVASRLEVRVQSQQLAHAIHAPRFIQAYKSSAPYEIPGIAAQPTYAAFDVGGVLEVRTVERTGALGHLLRVLPEIEYLSHDVLGATMVVQVKLRGECNRTQVVRAVTAALGGS